MAYTSTSTVWISQSIRAVASDLGDGRQLSVDIEGYKWGFERMLRELVAMDTCDELDDGEIEALDYLSQAHSKAIDKLVIESEVSDVGEQPPTILTGSVGRPKFDISHAQLVELLQSRFSVPDIAHLVGIC